MSLPAGVRRATSLLVRLLLLPALMVAAAVPATAKGPHLVDLSYTFRESRVLVSFDLADAFQRTDVQEAIQSTRPIALTYTVELRKTRFMWPDKTVDRQVLTRTVTYDNLTRQYTVASAVGDEEGERISLDSWEEVVSFLSVVRDVPVGHVGDLEPGEKQYLVRARVHLLSESFVWIIPKDVETDWEEVVLVTP